MMFKILSAAAAGFTIGYGIVSCRVDDFFTGFFSGAVTMIACWIWVEAINVED